MGELLAKLGTQHKACAKLLNGALTALDGRNVEQGLFYPFAQHTLARCGFGFIQHPQKRALFILAAHRFGKLEVAAGVDVHFKILTVAVNVQVANIGDVALFSFFNVIQQCTNGTDHSAILKVFLLDLLAKLRNDTLACCGILKTRLLIIGKRYPLAVEQKVPYLAHIDAAEIGNHLARRISAYFGAQTRVGILSRKCGGMHLTRRGIGKAKTVRKLAHANGAEIVIALLGEQACLKQCAGRNHTNNVATHESLCKGGILYLLANGNLVVLFDQLAHVPLVRVERNTAHRRAFCLAAISACKCELELTRGNDGVVKEHLVKISETVKNDIILILIFDFPILLHHWSHGSISFFIGFNKYHFEQLRSAICKAPSGRDAVKCRKLQGTEGAHVH